MSGAELSGERNVSERDAVLDEATLKVGLLMESAQAHQKLAEGQLERLRAHTEDLDSVVREEIRRTLVEELQALTAEAARATRALGKISVAGRLRPAASSIAAAVFCTLGPIGIARWALPSSADIAALRARRDELSAHVAKLEQQGGRIDWRRCGEEKRLCVRVDRKAPTYGDKADYYVIEGY
jgi:predicted phage gp36 major capsid-like protein